MWSWTEVVGRCICRTSAVEPHQLGCSDRLGRAILHPGDDNTQLLTPKRKVIAGELKLIAHLGKRGSETICLASKVALVALLMLRSRIWWVSTYHSGDPSQSFVQGRRIAFRSRVSVCLKPEDVSEQTCSESRFRSPYHPWSGHQ